MQCTNFLSGFHLHFQIVIFFFQTGCFLQFCLKTNILTCEIVRPNALENHDITSTSNAIDRSPKPSKAKFTWMLRFFQVVVIELWIMHVHANQEINTYPNRELEDSKMSLVGRLYSAPLRVLHICIVSVRSIQSSHGCFH